MEKYFNIKVEGFDSAPIEKIVNELTLVPANEPSSENASDPIQ